MEDITFSMDLTSSLNEGRINLYKSDDFLTKKIFYIAECQGLNQDGKRSFNYFIGLSENVSKYCESNFNQ